MQEESRYRSLLELIKRANPSMLLLGAAVSFEVIGALAAVMIPMQTRSLIDVMTTEDGIPWPLIGLLLALMLTNSLADGLACFLSGKMGARLVQSLRDLLLNHMVYLPMSFFKQVSSVEPATRLVKDTGEIKGLFSQLLVPLVSGVLNIVLSVGILWWLDWQLSCVLLAVVLIAFCVIVPVASGLTAISKSMQTLEASFLSRLAEVFASLPLLKMQLAELSERKRGQQAGAGLYEESMKEVRIQSVLTPILGVAMTAAFIVILGYGAIRVEQGALSIGSLIAFILYLFNIVMPLAQFSFFVSGINTAAGAAHRLYQLLQSPVENLKLGQDKLDSAASIRVQGVNFSYDRDTPVIHDLTFEIPNGKLTAVVGLSGSGKSTLFALLARLYPLDSGEIYWGQQGISQISLQAWRQQIAYVSQAAQLISGTVRENLSYGLSEPLSDERMLDALEQAQLKAWFEVLPEGFDTPLQEAGKNLSGGQRQRFAIARAILRDAKILLLDEVTSSQDIETEEQLQKALVLATKNRTGIIAAHRLYTVTHADQIVMLERGRLLGLGTHKTLMHELPEYQSFVDTQLLSMKPLKDDV